LKETDTSFFIVSSPSEDYSIFESR